MTKIQKPQKKLQEKAQPKERSFLENINVYAPGKTAASLANQSKKSKKEIILSSNECYVTPTNIVEALQKNIASINRYPKAYQNLKEDLAQNLNLESDEIIIGNGSDELINILAQAYLDEDNALLNSEHGFLMYPIAAQRVGAKVKNVAEKQFSIDVKKIVQSVKSPPIGSKKISAIFLANPGNPTGSIISEDDLLYLLNEIHGSVLLLIDTAYAEFVIADNYARGIELIKKFPNLVISGTFSKIYGLAGLRVGWMASNKDIINNLEKLRPPFNINALGVLAAIESLKDKNYLTQMQKNNALLRNFVRTELIKLNINVPESHGNFLLLEFKSAKIAKKVLKKLEANNIFIRSLDAYNLLNCLRVTIGSKEDMQIFLQEMKKIIKK